MQTEETNARSPEEVPHSDASAYEPTEKADGSSEPHAGSLDLLAPERTQHPSMKRVMDVPLTVTLRFGQRQLTLRELLDLNTGSLVELDQQVEEPVHLMLGDRIIARGEVVIVDGNYGMRVLEVVERYPGQHGRSSRTQ